MRALRPLWKVGRIVEPQSSRCLPTSYAASTASGEITNGYVASLVSRVREAWLNSSFKTFRRIDEPSVLGSRKSIDCSNSLNTSVTETHISDSDHSRTRPEELEQFNPWKFNECSSTKIENHSSAQFHGSHLISDLHPHVKWKTDFAIYETSYSETKYATANLQSSSELKRKRNFFGIDLSNLFNTVLSAAASTAKSLAGPTGVSKNTSANDTSTSSTSDQLSLPGANDNGTNGSSTDSESAKQLKPSANPKHAGVDCDYGKGTAGYDLMRHWDSDVEHHGRQKTADQSAGDFNSKFSHLDSSTGNVHMVDVSEKIETHRMAEAEAHVQLSPKITKLLQDLGGSHKGNLLTTAEVAGIMAAKQTSNLIPLCHNVPLSKVHVQAELDPERHRVNLRATARCQGVTGVEMEALTAVSVAALTVYDMCKGISHDMKIEGVSVVAKHGGKSNFGQLHEMTMFD